MNERIGIDSIIYTRRKFLRTTSATAGALALGPFLAALPSTAQAGQSLTPQSTLLVYTPDYVATDCVHFIDYAGSQWRMYGLYVRKPELQAITAGEQGLHVHGYHTGLMRGGHVLGAVASNVNATVLPLSQVVIRYGPPVSAI